MLILPFASDNDDISVPRIAQTILELNPITRIISDAYCKIRLKFNVKIADKQRNNTTSFHLLENNKKANNRAKRLKREPLVPPEIFTIVPTMPNNKDKLFF